MKRIYVLIDPRTGAVRYVGATSTALKKRAAVHIAAAKTRGDSCAAWLRELAAAGLRPIAREIAAPCEDWQNAEREAIRAYRLTGVLLNMADGGPGVPGLRPSSATRAKRSASLRRHYEDPEAMRQRRALGKAAGESEGSRRAARERMQRIWANPDLAAAMRARMVGSRARKAQQEKKSC